MLSAAVVASIDTPLDAFSCAVQAALDACAPVVEPRIDPFAACCQAICGYGVRVRVRVQALGATFGVRRDVIAVAIEPLFDAIATMVKAFPGALAPVGGLGRQGQSRSKQGDGKRSVHGRLLGQGVHDR